MKSLFLISFLFFITGCTMAPFTEEHTARTLGQGNNQLKIAAGSPGYSSISYKRGVSRNVDIGGIFEYQGFGALIGVNGKYRLSGKRDPLSIFSGLGAGSSTDYIYLGLVKSFKVTSKYEVAFSGRYNYFKWDIDAGSDANDASDFIDDIVDSIEGGINGSYSYISADVSNTYWFSSRFGLTASLTALSFVGSKADGTSVKAGLSGNFNF